VLDDEPTHADVEPTPSIDENLALPYDVLLKLLSGPRSISGEFSGATVPDRLMRLPIGCAAAWLHHHGRRCRQPRCPDTPGPLRRLLKVHSSDIIIKSSPQIHAELWLHPDKTMVRQVRQMLRDSHQELADAVTNGDILAPDRLQKTLDHGGDTQVELLAALLWADGLKDPAKSDLFRLLPSFLEPENPTETSTHPETTAPESTEKPRHRQKRQAAEAKVADLEGELVQTRTRLRERAEEATRGTAEIQRLQTALENQIASTDAAGEELGGFRKRTSELTIQVRDAERNSRRTQESNTRLREELGRERDRADQLEADRLRLTRELALARSEAESREAQLRAIPRGADAVADFLAEEEARIDQDLVIKQGGDRLRAEQEHTMREKLERTFRSAYPEYVPPRPRAIGETRQLRFTALGGGAEVGRSAYLIEIGSSRILVDCGIAVGRTNSAGNPDLEAMIPDLAHVGSLDAVVLTHAHTDHIGWLPALVAHQDPTVPIYCSEDTAAIVPIMLDDARRHYESFLAERQLLAAHNPHAEPVEEAYSPDDLYNVRTRLRALRYDEPRDILGGLRLTIWPAGHILGAASVLLDGGGRRVMLSGDISSEAQETVSAAVPPTDLDPVDLLVLESTYGDKPATASAAAKRQELIEFVSKTTQHGTAILPCFALGRGQEVLQILLRAKTDHQIDKFVTIWVDGLIRQINPLYMDRGKLDSDGFQVVGPGERRLAIDDCQRPESRAAIVTTSGMLNGGPVVEWASRLLGDKRHRIATLGYQDEGSAGGALGRQLRQRSGPPYDLPILRDNGKRETLHIKGPITQLGLSAHADQNGLVEFAKSIPANYIALVHGEPEAQEALRNRLTRELEGVCVSSPARETLTIG